MMRLKIKYLIFLSIFCCLKTNFYSQLNFRGGSKLIINGGTIVNKIFVVLNSSPVIPISTSGSSDGIIMESEYNRLQYNLSTTSTAITIPYMSSVLESFPLTVTPTTVGVGGGNIRFSTKKPVTRATGWDNSTYMPSDVTNMVGGSASVLDRFWIIDANGYTTKPAVTLSFTYIDAEWAVNGGNLITEAVLGAQRFNNILNSWQGLVTFPPAGSVNLATNKVSNITVTPANFFKSWVLSMKTVVLPIDLLSFEGDCGDSRYLLLNWKTASETNNDFYTIESSPDGLEWGEVTKIKGAGNSTYFSNYKYTITNQDLFHDYFRLKQTDYNGNYTYSQTIFPNCILNENIYFNNQQRELVIVTNAALQVKSDLYLFNSLGQLIYQTELDPNNGTNEFIINLSNVSPGMYQAYLTNEQKNTSKKIIIQK